MKRIKIQLSFLLLFFGLKHGFVECKNQWKGFLNKLKTNNQRFDFNQNSYINAHQAYSNKYPSNLRNFNFVKDNLQAQPSNIGHTISNPHDLSTSNSIVNSDYVNLPQFTPKNLPPELFYDLQQSNNPLNIETMRNFGLQSANNPSLTSPSLSLSTLTTPLLLLSSLSTLSSKSLGHNGGVLSPPIPNGFLKSLTTYLSSHLPSSPRQRKRQINRNFPTRSAYLKEIFPDQYFIEPAINFRENSDLEFRKKMKKYYRNQNKKLFSNLDFNDEQLKRYKLNSFKKVKNYSKKNIDDNFDIYDMNPRRKLSRNQNKKIYKKGPKKSLKMNKKYKNYQNLKKPNLEENYEENQSINKNQSNEESKKASNLIENKNLDLTSKQLQADNLEVIAEKLYSKIMKRVSSKPKDGSITFELKNSTNLTSDEKIV